MNKLIYNKITHKELKKIIREVYDSYKREPEAISNECGSIQIAEGIYAAIFKKKNASDT